MWYIYVICYMLWLLGRISMVCFTNNFNNYKLLFCQLTAWLLSVGVNSSYFVDINVNVSFAFKYEYFLFLYLITILFELWPAGTNTGMIIVVYTLWSFWSNFEKLLFFGFDKFFCRVVVILWYELKKNWMY